MQRGRPPKPTKIKAAEGNPGHRPLNRGDLAEAPKRPPCPAWLDQDARKEWFRMTKILMDRRLLRPDDQALLAAWCQETSDLALARKQLAELGAGRLLMKGRTKGDPPRLNPLLRVIREKTETIIQLASRFGFSPVDRSRIVFDDGSTLSREDPLEAILNGPAEHDPADTAIN